MSASLANCLTRTIAIRPVALKSHAFADAIAKRADNMKSTVAGTLCFLFLLMTSVPETWDGDDTSAKLRRTEIDYEQSTNVASFRESSFVVLSHNS